MKDKSPLDGFNLFGIVKETGVDDSGLAEFYSKYYPYDLYRDDDLIFYNNFFGQRKLGLSSLSLNPIKMYRGIRALSTRMKAKSIDGNLIGEGLVKGGVILFDKKGKAKYAYQEETGTELPVDDIGAAAIAIKEGKK